MALIRALITLNLSCFACTDALNLRAPPFEPRLGSRVLATPSETPEYIEEDRTGVKATERLELKSKLFAAAAACDRGFAAFTGSQERSKIDVLVDKLSALNPNLNPTRGLLGSDEPNVNCALEANWRLVYTTAYDVLSLACLALLGSASAFAPSVAPRASAIQLGAKSASMPFLEQPPKVMIHQF